MIKFRGMRGERGLIGLGLTEGNVERLKKNEPIHVNGAEMGLSYDILIFYGKDAAEIIANMRLMNATPNVQQIGKSHDLQGGDLV